MATPQLSPGILVREVDLTVGRAENVLDNIGALAGPFEIGPVNEPINITTEQELLNTFGKPSSSDNQYEYWLSASSFLSYGGVLKVVRTDGSTLSNANAGVAASVTTTKIKNFDDYNSNFLDAANNFYFAAKNPGSWANGLKVCVVDDKADQIVGIATTVLANVNIQVGYGVTVDLSGEVLPGIGTTSVFQGYLKGIITDTVDNIRGGSVIYVKIISRVSTGGTEYPISYAENNVLNSIVEGSKLSIVDNNGAVVSDKDSIGEVGITTFTSINGQQDEVYTGVGATSSGSGTQATFTITRNSSDGGVLSATVVNPGVGYSTGDSVTIAGSSVGGFNLTNGVIRTVGLTSSTTVVAASNATYTGVAGVSTVGTGVSFTIYRNGSGGIGTVFVANQGSGYQVGTVITIPGTSVGGVAPTDNLTLSVTALRDDKIVLQVSEVASSIVAGLTVDWYSQQVLKLDNGVVFWNTIAPKPGTSQYALERNSRSDEMHVVVVDDSGSLTGVKGNILEKHLFLSKAVDAISSSNSPTKIWYKNYLANFSRYIYAGTNPSNAYDGYWLTDPQATTFTYGANYTSDNFETDFDLYTLGETVWDRPAQDAIFSTIGQVTYTLANGVDYSAGGALKSSLPYIMESYNLFENRDDIAVDYLIMGPGGESITESQSKANRLISIADSRKDCVAVISPHRSGVVGLLNPNEQTNNIIEFFGPLSSSSYAIFDSGYKYMYDRFNNVFRYIPCNGDVAGLMCRTNIVAYPWYSPAGQQRGVIKNAIKLSFNPNKSQRDALYSARINPVINQPGVGIILFGDKTALSYASAFDRINVRRLFLTVEQALEKAAQAQLFEFNDQITRANFVNIVEPYLRDIQAKRGVYDFLVICDETNNTPDIIDNNEFRADIFLKPAKSINYITLTFVATRTGVSFEEVAGRV
jgi:hypothetical protein